MQSQGVKCSFIWTPTAGQIMVTFRSFFFIGMIWTGVVETPAHSAVATSESSQTTMNHLKWCPKCYQLEPHKAVAEVSKHGRARPLMDRKVVGASAYSFVYLFACLTN